MVRDRSSKTGSLAFREKQSLTYVLEQTSTDLPSLPRFPPRQNTEDTGHA